METVYIILLILAALYVPVYLWVRYSPRAERYGLRKYGPAVMLRTKLGMRLIDRYSVYTRFWRVFGAVSLVLSVILTVTIMYILAVGMLNLPSTLARDGLGIEYALAIPGLNPLLPVGFGIVGLIVAVGLHELAHGMQTAANGMRVDSTGLLYLVVPIGAFVEPNEEDVGKASRKAKMHLYAAGIATNFIVGTIAFLIFAVGLMGGITSPYGDHAAIYGITSDSDAYIAGIPAGSIITTVDGEDFTLDGGSAGYTWSPGSIVTVDYITEHSTGTADILWGVYIERITPGSPAAADLEAGWYILSMTSSASDVATVFYSAADFTDFMAGTVPGEVVSIEYLIKNADESTYTETADITLSSKGSVGFLGISTTTSGMNLRTPDDILGIAADPFHSSEGLLDAAGSAISYISGPFSGFSPLPESSQWWYDTPFDAGVFWWLCSLFYWIFWLNILLGVSNALPAVPFDGGFLFIGGVDRLLEMAGMKDAKKREDIADRAASYMTMAVWIMFLFVMMSILF